jgi:hypothetical protein
MLTTMAQLSTSLSRCTAGQHTWRLSLLDRVIAGQGREGYSTASTAMPIATAYRALFDRASFRNTCPFAQKIPSGLRKRVQPSRTARISSDNAGSLSSC